MAALSSSLLPGGAGRRAGADAWGGDVGYGIWVGQHHPTHVLVSTGLPLALLFVPTFRKQGHRACLFGPACLGKLIGRSLGPRQGLQCLRDFRYAISSKQLGDARAVIIEK